MRRRRKSDDEQVSSRITEAGYAPCPVVVILVGLAFFPPDLFAPLDQSRTRTTRTDLLGQRSELGGGFSLTVGHGRRLR